jgi:hypothetical protein
MKKADAAREAERLMAGTGWLPKQLRRARIVADDTPAGAHLLTAAE